MTKIKPIIVVVLYCCSLGLMLAQEESDREESQPRQGQTSNSPQFSQPRQRQEQATFLTGRVIYADGSPADLSATVELWCNGQVRQQVNTLNGVFSLTLGVGGLMGGGMTSDASIGPTGDLGVVNPTQGYSGSLGSGGGGLGGPQIGGSNRMDLSGCELQASQTGFQSEGMTLAFRRPMDPPDVGVLLLYKAGSITGTVTSVTSMSAPKKARKAYKKALKQIQRKKPKYEKAELELEKALGFYPQYSEAWNLLGKVRLQLQNEEGARQAFESAAADDPNYLEPHMSIMELDWRQKNWNQVSSRSTKVIGLHPYQWRAHFYHGFASVQLGQFEQAAESLGTVRKSYKAEEYPYVSYLLGLMLADKGKFNEAAVELKHFMDMNPDAPESDRIKGLLKGWSEMGLLNIMQEN